MPAEQELNYRDLQAWLRKFQTDRAWLYDVLDLWHNHAIDYVEDLDAAPLSQTFADITMLLVTWCDQHPTARIDGAALQRFYRAVAALYMPGARFGPKPTREQLEAAFRDALDVEARIRAAQTVVEGGVFKPMWLPTLNETDQAIAQYIREHPGTLGKQIADAVDVSFEHFRRVYSQKLVHHGFTNRGGTEGYYPPTGV